MPVRATVLFLTLLLAVGAAAASGTSKQSAPQKTWRYPVKGDHTYGNLDNTGFGVTRPDGSKHKGQDIIANCGQPLIATHKAKVQKRGYADGIGYYVVLKGVGTKFSFSFDHMKGPGSPRKGKVVKPGRRVGYVGASEVSTGICHLHFELWRGGWGKGRRIDPLPRLRYWEKFSKGELVREKDLGARGASKAIAFEG